MIHFQHVDDRLGKFQCNKIVSKTIDNAWYKRTYYASYTAHLHPSELF